MIDDRNQVERLVPKLREALPLIATLSPPLAALVREESPGIDVPKRCAVTRVDYAGDEGGIMCGLTFASNNRDGDRGKSIFRVHHTPGIRSTPAVRARNRRLPEAITHRECDLGSAGSLTIIVVPDLKTHRASGGSWRQ